MGAGIHGPPGPRTSRSSSVRQFKKIPGPRPVRSADRKIFSVRVRSGPRILKFSWSASGPVRGPLLFSSRSGPVLFSMKLLKLDILKWHQEF